MKLACHWCGKVYDGTEKMHFWWSSDYKNRNKSRAHMAHAGCGYPRLECVDRSVFRCQDEGVPSDVELKNLFARRDNLLATYDWDAQDELFLWRASEAVRRINRGEDD